MTKKPYTEYNQKTKLHIMQPLGNLQKRSRDIGINSSHNSIFLSAKIVKKTKKHLINLAQYQALMLKSTHYFDRNNTILT